MWPLKTANQRTARALLDAEKESDVARGNQSKTSIGLDRRELLAATAVVTAAGIVPNADAVGATNSAQVVNAARVSLSGNEALNVSTSTARKIQEIAQRNRIRQEAALPSLSIPRELRKIKNAEVVDLPRAVGERIKNEIEKAYATAPLPPASAGQLSTGTELMVVNVERNDVLKMREYATANSPISS
jgi:hypothetical protein